MTDVFSSYEQGLKTLLERLGQDHPRYTEALTFQSRLLENMAQARRYGDTETRRAERAQIVDGLNRLALETGGPDFNELCEPKPKAGPRRRRTPPATTIAREPECAEGSARSVLTALPPCPFIAGPKITDPRLFVGRREELRRLATAMAGAQPISVNVVGARRIGKSSLLYHFYQTWEQRVRTPARFVVAFLSLQEAAAQTEADLYRAIARSLLDRPAAHQRADLVAALNRQPLDRSGFAEAMKGFRAQNLLPVLCLDEFEALFQHPRQFDDGFYDALHALMDGNVLMVIAASHEPLDVYRRQHRLTSSFFNLGHVLRLGDLTEEEAADLVRLPASTISGAPAALSLDEQRLARAWGRRHPYLLQLAAYFLYQARQEGRDTAWARMQFEAEARRVPRVHGRLRPLRWLAWDAPARLGRLAKRTGETLDDLTNWVIGMVILIVVILAVLGVLTWPQLVELARLALGR